MIERLPDWVRQWAQRSPESSAVVWKGRKLTYGRLEELTNQLARALVERGCRPGDRVCLLLPKSAAAIIGIIGILKADCIYVPLDSACPAARLAKVVRTCKTTWILAGGGVAPVLHELATLHGLPVRVGWLDGPPPTGPENVTPEFTLDDLRTLPAEPAGGTGSRPDPAYIMFTSGSTGNPKGVVITHSNVIHFVDWAVSYFGIREKERLSGHSPLHFDLSVFDLFGSFAAGAELHPVAPELNILPNKLVDFMRHSELTQWFSVPSALTYMAKFDVVKEGDFPNLKRLLWCGEVLPVPVLAYWMKRLPHVAFTNLYGPTEATVASAYYTVPVCPEDLRSAIPIGRPCGGEALHVLDEALHPVDSDSVGYLYIEGAGLSPGYFRDPDKTMEVFVRNPSAPNSRLYKTGDLAKVGRDGLVYFVGRADTQIKSRGHRIELGEISAALNSLDLLRESAVVALPAAGFEGATICCAYVSSPHREVGPAALRRELSKMLPGYMLPTRWMAMPELPKNANGKIDTRLLREQFPVERIS